MTSGHRWLLAAFTLSVPSGPTIGQAAPANRDIPLVFRGSLGPDDQRETRRIDLDHRAVRWEIVLDIADPDGVDLDLYVYAEHPERAPEADPICRSDGVGKVERCRLIPPRDGPVWVQVVPLSGERRTEYVVRARALHGVAIEGTQFVAQDARSIEPRSSVQSAFTEGDLSAGQHLFVARPVTGSPEDWIVSVTSGDPSISLGVTAYDSAGRVVAPSVGTGYLEVRRPGSTWFIVVKLGRPGDLRRAPTYSMSLAPAGGAIPITLAQGEFRASGAEAREYSLPLKPGSMAIITLEGRANLRVQDRDNVLPVVNSFGLLRQRSWVGTGVGGSRHLLQGAVGEGLLRIRIEPRIDSLRYQRKAEWALRVLVSPPGQGYVVRFNSSNAVPWSKWWTEPSPEKTGTVAPGEIAVLEVPVPTDATASDNSPAQRRPVAVPLPGGQQFLARLNDEAARGFDLAVCNEDGQALDIGDAAVRWEWPRGAGILYLVVLPDPWSATSPAGEFRVQLTRSSIGK